MTDRQLENLEKLGWFFIIPLVVTGIAAACGHIFDGFFNTGNIEEIKLVNTLLFGESFFDHWLRFREYPWARMLHMIPGIIFYVCLPLQFMRSVRNRYRRLHRISGYLVLLSSAFLVFTGFVFAFIHPYVGFKEQVPTVFFSIIYVVCIWKAMSHVYQRNFLLHREWMVRVFSMGLGIYTVRVFYSFFLHFSDQPSTEFFATSFWIGMAFNLVVSEIWVNISREYAAKRAMELPVKKESYSGSLAPAA